MILALIERADALLQSQQAFVDLSPVDLSLLVLLEGVGSPLATGQVDERELALGLLPQPQLYLQYCVRARGVGICAVLARYPQGRPLAYCRHELLGTGDLLDSKPNDVDILACIFPGLQLLPPVKEIE